MTANKRIVVDNDDFCVSRKSSNSRREPAHISIEAKRQNQARSGYLMHRRIQLTIDELFDLTEILDDLCDAIEDDIERGRPAAKSV